MTIHFQIQRENEIQNKFINISSGDDLTSSDNCDNYFNYVNSDSLVNSDDSLVNKFKRQKFIFHPT